MDQQNNELTPVKPNTKTRKKKALNVDADGQQTTKVLFDEFITSYTGNLSSNEIMDEFIKKYPGCGYLREISRSEVNKILGPIINRRMCLDGREESQGARLMPYSFEETKDMFHRFLMSYKHPVKFRQCLNAFIESDPNLSFLHELCDRKIEAILGKSREWKEIQKINGVLETPEEWMEIRETSKQISDTAGDPGSVLLKCYTKNKKRSNDDIARDFPEKLYQTIERFPHLYGQSKPARPIDGENEWVRSEFLKIVREGCGRVLCRNDVMTKFIHSYPKLKFFANLTADQFNYRYGSVHELLDGKEQFKKRSRNRVDAHSCPETDALEFPMHPLHGLSPESRKDIESALFDDSDAVAPGGLLTGHGDASGIEVALLSPRKDKGHEDAASESGDKAFTDDFGDIVIGGSTSVDEGLLSFDSGVISGFEAFDSLCETPLRRSPRFSQLPRDEGIRSDRLDIEAPLVSDSANPRRSPRFIEAVNTDTIPRRSPRLAKQSLSGRRSFP
jgi:hypothetical protein